MPTILRRLPFYPDKTTLRIPDGPAIEVNGDQIVVWLSIAPVGETAPPASARRIPPLLDLGFNGSFLLREDHLNEWLKLKLDEKKFRLLRTVKVDGEIVPTFEAEAWLHANVAGFRDQMDASLPARIELIGGMMVCPTLMSRFHLPLLGLSALRRNRLRLLVNGEKRYVTLRAPFQQV